MERRELLKCLATTASGGVLATTLGGRSAAADTGAVASPPPDRTVATDDVFEDKTDWLQSLLDSGEGLVQCY